VDESERLYAVLGRPLAIDEEHEDEEEEEEQKGDEHKENEEVLRVSYRWRANSGHFEGH
jgi:hypothetical protein